MKGMAAYTEHAYNLGHENPSIYEFIDRGLVATTLPLSADQLVQMVLECGKNGVDAMALLDKANTDTYGNPEITKVDIGVRKNPGILISGHDLRDLYELLEQTGRHGCGRLHPQRDAPRTLLPGIQEIQTLRRKLR